MEKNLLQARVMQLLKTLTGPQLNALQHLAQSDFFCPGAEVRKLLAELAKSHPDFSASSLDRVKVFRATTGKTELDNRKLNELLSALTELVLAFLAFCQLKNDPVQLYLGAAEQLAGSADGHIFGVVAAKLEDALKRAPESHHALYQRFRISQEKWSHWATQRHRDAPKEYSRMAAAHRQYCASVNALLDCEHHGRAQWLKETQTPLKAEPNENCLVTQLFDGLSQLTRNPIADEAGFRTSQEFYQKHFLHFGPAERDAALRLLLNYCALQGQQNSRVFYRLRYELIVWAISQGRHLGNRWLRSDDDFLNYALTFGQQADLDGMHRFIQQHKDQMAGPVRNDAEQLARAYYHYFLKEYTEARKILTSVSGQELKYGFRYHSLHLRTSFEVCLKENKFEDMESVFDTYAKYFNRKAVLKDQHREKYLRLLYFTRRLVYAYQISHLRDLPSLLKRLKDDLEDPLKPKPIAIDWVLEHIDTLESKAAPKAAGGNLDIPTGRKSHL